MPDPPIDELANLQLSREKPKPRYKFWETQPVAQFKPAGGDTSAADDGPIDEAKSVEDVRQEPFSLNAQFQWCLCNLEDQQECQEVYDLLRLNYVEDDDEMFRFCYSPEFLRWALCPPGYIKDWHLGVRVKANQKLACTHFRLCFECAACLMSRVAEWTPLAGKEAVQVLHGAQRCFQIARPCM
jgi:Myristoyl-CoA:protein N-myristoyltransferase, N-terminal domain